MPKQPSRRLPPRAVYELLHDANAASSSALDRAHALTEDRHNRSGRRRLIGVAMNLVPWQVSLEAGQWRHHAMDDVLAGMRAHADASGLDILFLTALSSEVSGQATHYGDLCRAHGASGIILCSFVPEEPELTELAASGFPCVSIDTNLIGPHASFVACDSVGGAITAVRHLAENGRKRIAYLGGWGHEPISLERRLGYESALDELRRERRPEYILKGGWQHGQARSEVSKLLQLEEPPDAIFCASDRMAIGAMLACEEAGFRIPEDIAVVGFDDEDIASLTQPSLTTVRQDRTGLGTAAVEALLRIFENPDSPPPTVILPVELVVRESSRARDSGSTATPAGDEPGGSPLLERLTIREVFESLGTDEVFHHTTFGDVSDEHRERWRPEERRTIALAVDTTPNQSYRHAFFDEVFFGLRAAAHERSADLILLTHIWPGIDPFPPFLDLCRRYEADGIIVSSLPPEDPQISALTESGFPCAAFDVELFGKRPAFVSFDNVEAGVEVVRHLAESGRSRIAFIGGRGDERPSVDRQFGYKSELARLGLPYLQEYVHTAQWLHDRAYEATRRMLELAEPPDAIFAASDIMAVGAMAAIEEAGLGVPGDIAVAGVDDLAVASLVTPSLTSVRQSQRILVTAMMDAVFRLLESPEATPTAIVLPVELIVRESSAAAAGSDTTE
jgi:LacI family transcriptional regulator